MSDFATITDITSLFRALDTAETTRATSLLPVVSDLIRYEGKKRGKDIDAMVADDLAYANEALNKMPAKTNDKILVL